MVIDSSACIAILFDEPERLRFVELVGVAELWVMSAINYTETRIVAARSKNIVMERGLPQIIDDLAVTIQSATPHLAEQAALAYFRFGKGNHPARLNLGDCFAYAPAMSRGEPLLFKGGDFGLTDVEIAHG